MKLSHWVSVLVLSAMLLPAFAGATDFPGRLSAALENGSIDRDEAMLNSFYYVFDRSSVRADLLRENDKPLKCFTQILSDYQVSRDEMDPTIRAKIDALIAGRQEVGKSAATYTSPSGIFLITYATTGGDAVPSTDVNPANGIPDYVEKIAVYSDSSWSKEIDYMGFQAPNVGGGTYAVSFQNMGAYGYTVSQGSGSSYIVLENDFIGFPANSDPEGNQLGAAKATMAHEFKHASQMNTGSWDGWAEMDATWMEDMVFDETNDYYNYLTSGNSIVDPATPLDAGTGASYEDMIWQHFIEESFGPGTVREHADRILNFPSETITYSYNEVFLNHGSSFREAFTDFATWNYLVGTWATTSLPGYEEAADFPVILPGTHVDLIAEDYPYTTGDTLENMAAHPYKCKGMASLLGAIRVEFEGLNENRIPELVALMKVKAEFGGGWEREDIPLDANLQADYTLSRPGSELLQTVILIVYPKRTGGDTSYNLTISDNDVSTSVADRSPVRKVFGLNQNRPNPFNPTTSISFVLPGSAAASLTIYNAAGRAVRTLVHGKELSGGTHSYMWDGLDDHGNSVASGIYHYRLEAGRLADSRRMILIR